MTVYDYTIDKKFSELKAGTCFVLWSQYFMKLHIKYYSECTNKDISQLNYAVNLNTGIAEAIKPDEKVRVVEGKIIIE